jgi:hypothetical protein
METILGGPSAPITWIGYRTVDCTRRPMPIQFWPERISVGAFGSSLEPNQQAGDKLLKISEVHQKRRAAEGRPRDAPNSILRSSAQRSER